MADLATGILLIQPCSDPLTLRGNSNLALLVEQGEIYNVALKPHAIHDRLELFNIVCPQCVFQARGDDLTHRRGRVFQIVQHDLAMAHVMDVGEGAEDDEQGDGDSCGDFEA